ncbi:hypothetical protein OIE61_05390 [Streptomyces sp. NBC_01762]|uniref:hypothetical protein n=1 Tax=unclassified Streptomyces TaxID=2593676 RepID=UPI002DD93D53|nr:MULTISPECIES: hypothetical protein [unclassified Streptomyces]WSC43431.1 hypothetical protein OIE61_05390 [Streptomyces sp. NBC_01762]WSD22968.1 hypothetical protein OHA26_05445 [Streptomyces sp. NBC_01751]
MGADHRAALAAQHRPATGLLHTGRPDRARRQALVVLRSRTAKPGNTHPNTIVIATAEATVEALRPDEPDVASKAAGSIFFCFSAKRERSAGVLSSSSSDEHPSGSSGFRRSSESVTWPVVAMQRDLCPAALRNSP